MPRSQRQLRSVPDLIDLFNLELADQNRAWFFAADFGACKLRAGSGVMVGILRYRTYDDYRPVGIPFDIEGSAQFRSTGSDTWISKTRS